VNVGDYLKDGADIVNIEDIDAIYVDFRLPERFQGKVKRGQTAQLDIDALPGRKYTAQVQAIDPLIDANGRSIGIRACVDNRQLQLRPGMFARVNAIFGVREHARVVPEEAIVPQGGKQYVIKLVDGANGHTQVSKRVEVKVGLRRPGKVEITEGLEPGDTVVTSGQQRVQRDGMLVTVVEAPSSLGRSAGERAVVAPKAPVSASTLGRSSEVAAVPVVTTDKGVRLAAGANPCGDVPAAETRAGGPAGKAGRPARSRDAPLPREPV
jgi:membrane fusion protein (multidrug efflux system)